MKLFASLATAVLSLSCLAASAQISIYGKLDIDHHTDTNSGNSFNVYGGGLGVQDDFAHLGPLSLGADLRGDFESGNQNSYRSFLGGVPVGFKIPIVGLKPYVEPLFGVGGDKFTGSTGSGGSQVVVSPNYTNKFTYGAVGGLLFTVLPHVDWRIIEVGYTHEKDAHLTNPNILVSTGLGLRF